MKFDSQPRPQAARPRGASNRSSGSLVLRSLLLSAVTAWAACPAYSAVGIDIQIAPPAPRVIEAPPPRAGFVWAPGYWRWDGHRHVWIDGHWIKERRGQHWVPDRWVEHGGHYRYEAGHWER